MAKNIHNIDASGQVLGRLASQIAGLLRGKDKADFDPSKEMGSVVIVENIDKLKVSGKKMEKKEYFRHSGYLGGWRKIQLKDCMKKGRHGGPAEVLRMAVFGMLPKNKLRAKMIKRLKIK